MNIPFLSAASPRPPVAAAVRVHRILRLSHSAVVPEWRERERKLRRRGFEVTLVTAKTWYEGGRLVRFDPVSDGFARAAHTLGRHPNLFLFDPRLLWQVLGEQWDVIDIHEEPCALATAEVLLLRWARRQRAPFVLYSAQNIEKRYPPPFRWMERWALRHAAGLSVCNRAAGRIVERKGFTSHATLIPLGVDVERFSPADREPPKEGMAHIGYVGRLADHKGVDVLLRSLARLEGVTLELVGAGPEEGSLRELATILGLGGRVSFAGSSGHEELPLRYRSFDAVVVPSVPTPAWEEQFCRVAIEAMASGVPVVASRSGALPEVVGEAGLLVDPGDEQSLAVALERLAGDPSLWMRLRRAGLERAREFTWDAVAAHYDTLYREVAA